MSLIRMELNRVLSSRSAFPTTVTVSYFENGAGKERRARGWKCFCDGGAATNEEAENLPSAGRPLNREIRGNQREKETRKSTLEGIFLIPTNVQNDAPILMEITKP